MKADREFNKEKKILPLRIGGKTLNYIINRKNQQTIEALKLPVNCSDKNPLKWKQV